MTFILQIIIVLILFKIYKKFIKPYIGIMRISTNVKKSILIFILSIVPLLLYFIVKLDMDLYYYGKNNYNIHDKLPFNLVPQNLETYKESNGFIIVDARGEYEEIILGNGIVYWNYPNVKINEVLKYGFNKEKLVALVNDSFGKEYYIIFDKSNDKNSKQTSKLTIQKKDEYQYSELLKWTNVKGISTKGKELMRSDLEMVLILLIIILIYNWLSETPKFKRR